MSDPTAAERAREVVHAVGLSNHAADNAVYALLAHPDLLAALAVEAGGMEQVGWYEHAAGLEPHLVYVDPKDDIEWPRGVQPVYRRVEGDRDE